MITVDRLEQVMGETQAIPSMCSPSHFHLVGQNQAIQIYTCLIHPHTMPHLSAPCLLGAAAFEPHSLTVKYAVDILPCPVKNLTRGPNVVWDFWKNMNVQKEILYFE